MPTFLHSLIILLLSVWSLAVSSGCAQQQMQRQARESDIVVLDIGHYYKPGKGGQGARTPDDRYGCIEECEFWYQYVIYIKRTIERAGYSCIITNRGSEPADPKLAAAARAAGVHHVRSPRPEAIYLSKQHPHRMAVGMLSVNYALDQAPGCVVFLHHNSNSENWLVSHKGAFYCNERGTNLAQNMARVMDKEILDHGMPNGGTPCRIIIRNDGRRGGGDWLNACNESYVPAVITEVAFLSNPEHARFLSQSKNAIRYAEALGRGIVRYMQQR